MTRKIDILLELYPDLDELFESLDITPFEVLRILLIQGHVVLPPFLEDEDNAED